MGGNLKKKLIGLCVLVIFLASLVSSAVQGQSQTTGDANQQKAQDFLNTLTPEERVGQLFMITFKGSTPITPDTQIYDLITKYHIGGVVLSAANDNFTAVGTIPNAFQLIGQLQTAEFTSSQHEQSDPTTGTSFIPAYVPLFIGLDQEGDGAPTNQIFTGLTNLPDEMAIGATWNPDYATQVGAALGSQLKAIGVNLLLGPSLDVLQMSPSTGYNDLGVRTFGGDPFWVGEMGKAYIAGLHEGSNGKLATIATHFPGSGSTDRLPEEEVATVRKTLDQLKQIDLAPFFAVTGNAPSAEATTDGLLVSDIRYQGFQGNISDSIKPVSFDVNALSQLMGLETFAAWRSNGGLLVSDDLGSQAVRRFVDSTEKTFNARQVALDAFNAGNDLLYADNFVANGDPNSFTTIQSTLDLFVQKYTHDTDFKQRVDQSVLRILTLKFKLYQTFSYSSVFSSESGLNSVNNYSQIAFNVAKQAVTLISPMPSDLDSLLPKPPQANDHIVFFTDTLTAKQCPMCADKSAFSVNGLQNAIIKLYGAQVYPDNLVSYSFLDLENYLNSLKDAPGTLAGDLSTATWIVFSTLNVDQARPKSSALKDLLSKRPDLIHNKKVIVFAFNAPYFLDATDISKLTAYYGLYSKGPDFLDVAAKVLFQEIVPTTGALPVSVPGVGYDVIQQTSPDPTQTITLYLNKPEQSPDATQPTAVTPVPTVIPSFTIGETIDLQTGPIYDRNHNLVPDETGVQFIFSYAGDNSGQQMIPQGTKKGIASLTYRIEKSGQLQITAISDQATNSNAININIPVGPTPATTIVVMVTQAPSLTATATIIPSLTPTSTPTVIPLRSGKPDMGEWSISMLIIAMGSALTFIFTYRLFKSLRWGIRWGLCTILGGLAVYIYLSSGLSASISTVQHGGTNGIMGYNLLGMFLGWVVAFIWWFVLKQSTRKSTQSTR